MFNLRIITRKAHHRSSQRWHNGTSYRSARYREPLQTAVNASGLPLFWGDWKSVGFWAAFFRDLGVTHVLDLTAGAGGAAVGALYADVKYEGFCCNQMHKQWLDNVMDKCIFGALVDGAAVGVHMGLSGKGDAADKKLLEKMNHYFAATVKEALRLCGSAQDESGGADGESAEEEDDEGDGSSASE